MISLDQVLLLEQKVENAVEKIQQLNAENAALRRKCAELTNALSAKTEQFSSFQTDQGRIEEGILKVLERLNTVENAVHSATLTVESTSQAKELHTQPQNIHPQPQQEIKPQPEEPSPETSSEQSFEQVSINSFDTASPVAEENQVKAEETDNSQPTFDIF